MRASTIVSVLSLLSLGQGIRIIQGNDDGWAEMYARELFSALSADGHDIVLSCPAENKSGSGSSDAEPTPRKTACEYNSCPANSGPTGTDPNNRRLNWVNSYPVTAIKYGMDTFGPQIWNGEKAELAVTGINVGGNKWLQLPFSGTVGAAVQAVKAGTPAIALSADAGGGARSFDPSGNKTTPQAKIYSELSRRLVDAVVKSGTPYLPKETFLNVNFPKLSDKCKSADDFKFVLTRVNTGLFSGRDAEVCGVTRLPTEFDVGNRSDCFVSVSPADSADKTSADPEVQAEVNKKLGSFLSCLPK